MNEVSQHAPIVHPITLLRIGPAAVALSALLLVLALTSADPDLWGHLRFGLDLLADSAVDAPDPYSYATHGQRWINHEWLSEFMFALAWSAAGAAALIWVKVCVGLLTVGAACAPLLNRRVPVVRGVIVFVALGLPLLVPFFFLVRPQIFTFLLFALVLLIVRRAEAGAHRWLWAAAPVLALWVNLHGGVLAGAGILGLWGTLHLARDRAALRTLAGPALASGSALLVNPYGPDLLVFLLETATVPRPEIVDWQPLRLMSTHGAMYATVLLSAVAGVTFSRLERRPVLLAICALMALLPWIAVRHLPLFSLAALVFCGEHVADAWERWLGAQRQAPDEAPAWIGLLYFVAALALLALGASRGAFTTIHVAPEARLPVGAVELLARSGLSGNLAIDFGWGQYSLWHLHPRIKVGMDGRRETVYPPDVYQAYLDFHRGTRDWDAFLERFPTDFVLVGARTPPANLLRLSPAWSAVHEDHVSALFVRRDSPLAEPLAQAAASFVAPPAKTRFP